MSTESVYKQEKTTKSLEYRRCLETGETTKSLEQIFIIIIMRINLMMIIILVMLIIIAGHSADLTLMNVETLKTVCHPSLGAVLHLAKLFQPP